MHEHFLSHLSTPDAPAQWRGFSDRVMGGVSQETVTIETLDGQRCIRLRGDVRLENNGGFVQVALPLEQHGTPFDAGAFGAVRLRVWGNGESYRLHLRTADCRRPQQYYWAAFVAQPTWQTIDMPFSTFEPKDLAAPFNPRALTRLGVVAYGRPFTADVAVARVSLVATGDDASSGAEES